MSSDVLLSEEDYVIGLNNLSPFPINIELLLDFISIANNPWLPHVILSKYNLIPNNINIHNFMAMFDDKIKINNSDYIISNDMFIKILQSEYPTLHEDYLIIVRYIEWYNYYKKLFENVSNLKRNYREIESVIEKIKQEYINLSDNIIENIDYLYNLVNLEHKLSLSKLNILYNLARLDI